MGASVLWLLGPIRPPEISHLPRAMARPRHVPGGLSAPGWHCSNSGLGAIPLPTTRTGSHISTGSSVSNMPTRAGLFITDWKNFIFTTSRNEVRSFSYGERCLFWLDNITLWPESGCRRSMLYLDLFAQGRCDGFPQVAGRENSRGPSIFCGSSTPRLTRRSSGGIQTHRGGIGRRGQCLAPNYVGGLGLRHGVGMGWMHDHTLPTLLDPIHLPVSSQSTHLPHALRLHREYSLLPLSHDEVVHGKGSSSGRNARRRVPRFANLRLLFGYMYGPTGQKRCSSVAECSARCGSGT